MCIAKYEGGGLTASRLGEGKDPALPMARLVPTSELRRQNDLMQPMALGAIAPRAGSYAAAESLKTGMPYRIWT